MADDGLLIIEDGPVDTAMIAGYERSRRDLLRRGVVVGGAALAASSIPTLLRVRTAFAAAEGDAPVLEAAVALEQSAVLAYRTAASSGLLKGAAQTVAERFRRDEQQHLDALTSALERLGGKPPSMPGVEDVKGLSGLRSQRHVLQFAVELESMAVAAYYDAHSKLKDARLLQSAASIMSNEGQHLVVLRQALGDDPVPNAFESGKPPR